MIVDLITRVHAPMERCFDLSRSIDLHVQSTARTGEAAVSGVTSGLIGSGQQVTWRARHLGIWQEFTSRITAFERPTYFQDTMMRGAFRSFRHDHFFESIDPGTTLMRDVLIFSAPFPVLGRIAETFLRPYLAKFLRERNSLMKRVAEGEEWRQFL
jgi:ligand-binding SRPBCC domain-containing protein